MPPPPRWTARWFQLAGKTTRKLIGRALGDLSTGAMEPSITHCAAADVPWLPPAGGAHTAVFTVTAATGSPIAEVGMVPIFSTVQSASVITLSAPRAGSLAAGG